MVLVPIPTVGLISVFRSSVHCSTVFSRSSSADHFSRSLPLKAGDLYSCSAKKPSPKVRTTTLLPMPPSFSMKIVAEYAKSNRSSCKKCSKTIAAKALRLGLVSRDTRGFDMTRWHHLDCFPIGPEMVRSAEKISGFSSLKMGDQDALKKLMQQCSKPSEEKTGDRDEENEQQEITPNGMRKRKRTQETDGDQEVIDSGARRAMKTESSTSHVQAGLEISISPSDIKDKYRDADLLPKWKAFQTVIFLERDDGLHDSKKIAAFDFDGCLVKTSVKRVGADAWSLMYPSIPEKLQNLYNLGYKLVIFTNESNIDRWKNKRQVAIDSKIGRLNNFIKLVEVPIQVFIACGYDGPSGKADPFRKPKTGMWHIMEKQFNSSVAIDMDQSFYVGDAAGRPNDHSDADIKFAQAIGLKFYVPEEYFAS